MANKSKRRDFLKATTAAGMGFWVSTRSARAQNRSANERINHAAIGSGGMGGGDVKLAGMIGLLVGIPGAAVALWIAAVSGGLVAIVLLASGKKGRKEAIPFGPFMSLGAIVVVLSGTDLVSQYIDAIDFFA